MPRSYRTSFENVTVSAAQDLVSLKAITTPAAIVRYWVGATSTTLVTAQSIRLDARIATATLTAGSGGGAGSVVKKDASDGAATATTRINDTTGATTSGAFTVVDTQGVHIFNGFDSGDLTLTPVIIPINGGFTFRLLSTVTGTVAMSGGIEWVEQGS